MIFDRLAGPLRSIHTRLLMVIFVSGVSILLLFRVQTIAHRIILASAFHKRVASFVQYIVKDLGTPPDYNRAVEVARKTELIISYSSPEANWSTAGNSRWPPFRPGLELRISPSIRVATYRGRRYFIYDADSNHRFLFEILREPANDSRLVKVNLFVLIALILLLMGAYIWVRRIMAPLRPLSHGVRKLAAGSLDHRLPVHGNDELGELASSFNAMAERLQRLIDSKDRMLLDVSHELRSPLTRMRLALEMLSECALKQSLAEDVDEMDGIVTTLLTNARMHSANPTLHPRQVDLVSVIRRAIRPLEAQPPGVDLQEAPDSVEAFLDPEKAQTVLRNIVGNAMKYSRETSGPVAISVRIEPESNTVEIRDEGIGIPERDLPFIFEPFYRVDRSRSKESGGFGLGLSLCKAIMEAHNGSISVQSVVGKGTTFQLHFPRKPAEKLS
jgi:signal transduction histidine kinase